MEELAGWLSAEQAAERLGVKPATLYAYVSRRVVRRRRSPEGHSRFDPAEIERLARRGRPRRAPGASELVIESRVTRLGDDRPYYRGRDALELAATWELEQVAGWLWTGEPGSLAGWQAASEAVEVGRAAQAGLPADVLPLERLQVITPALAATDPLRHNPDPSTVVTVGRQLIAGMVACLPGDASGSDGTIAARLWSKLTGASSGAVANRGAGALSGVEANRAAGAETTDLAGAEATDLAYPPADPRLVDALRAALVLLADHELAASTFAARVAASVRANPYAVVMAGLGAMGGALHGGASLSVEAMLAEARDPAHARQVVGQRLRRGERIPGLGHVVYKGGDGRARLLLDRVRAAAPEHPRLAVVDAMQDEAAQRRRLPASNIDFALAALVEVSGMVTGAGEAIFAIARTVGWLAHALEEYAHPARLRPRAVYVGPLSQAPPSPQIE